MKNAKHSSRSVEHFTPHDVVEAARELLQGIDVDPASCAAANKYVKAEVFYTRRRNGLVHRPWYGRVFLNPPGGLCDVNGDPIINAKDDRPNCRVTGDCGRPPGHTHVGPTSSAKYWWRALSEDYYIGHTRSAFFIGFSQEILQSAQIGRGVLAVPSDFPCCYPEKRLEFLTLEGNKLVEGDQPTHANVLVYLPPSWDAGEERRFYQIFGRFGATVWPRRRVKR